MRFRAGSDPVLYLDEPAGRRPRRRGAQMLDAVGEARHACSYDAYGDPEIETRIAQYEMAYRMQTSVPELMDLSKEPRHDLRAVRPGRRASPARFAANCLLARRLAERGVRFVQLYHRGWDQHDDLPRDLALQCQDTDQPSAALVTDLKQRGLLDDTLVVWGGEFGRTVYQPGQADRRPTTAATTIRAASRMWMAGGGIKPGVVLGETDDFSYNVVTDPVSRPRPAGDDPAPAGHRPQAADVQVPGPRLPPDRRARRGREEAPRLSGHSFLEELGDRLYNIFLLRGVQFRIHRQ